MAWPHAARARVDLRSLRPRSRPRRRRLSEHAVGLLRDLLAGLWPERPPASQRRLRLDRRFQDRADGERPTAHVPFPLRAGDDAAPLLSQGATVPDGTFVARRCGSRCGQRSRLDAASVHHHAFLERGKGGMRGARWRIPPARHERAAVARRPQSHGYRHRRGGVSQTPRDQFWTVTAADGATAYAVFFGWANEGNARVVDQSMLAYVRCVR